MKKTISMLLIIFTLAVITLASCKEGDRVQNNQYNDSNDIMSKYITNLQPIEKYQKSLVNYVYKNDVSNDNKSNYNNFDTLDFLPVYGTYLENTSLVVCVFYENEKIIGTSTVSIDEIGEDIKINEFAKDIENTKYFEALSDKHCCRVILNCLKNCPDFEILGLVFDTKGYNTIYPIGIEKGKSYIQYCNDTVLDFNLIPHFETVEEGYNLFNEYFKKKNTILSSIPIFAWKEKKLYDSGYIHPFQYDFLYQLDLDTKEYDFLNYYDSVVAIPLVSDSGEEGIYVLHQLYYRNELIAELVLAKKSEGTKTVIIPVYKRVGVFIEDGRYGSLQSSVYVDFINDYKSKNPDCKIKSIIFSNGEFNILEQ